MDEDVIPILEVQAADLAIRWYQLLGFTSRGEHRSEPDQPGFIELVRGEVRLFLSEQETESRGESMIYLRVRDVEAIASEFGMTPEDVPGAREIELRDPDGNRVRIGTPSE